MSTYSRYDESSDDVILMSHPVQHVEMRVSVVLNLQRILWIRSRSFHSHLNAFVT